MTTFRNVLLIGGSGTLGSVLLKALEESSYNVTVLSRQESTSQLPEGTKVIRADYGDTSSLEAAMKGQDVVISTVGPTATDGQKPFIDAAAAAGVKRFIPSEFGPDTLDPRVTEFIPVLPFKVQTVDYLRTKEDKMEWTSLITSLWFDWALRDGHIGFDLDTKTATITDGGKGQFTGTTLDRVAKATVKILDHADKTRNTYVYTASFHLCQNDLLALLEKMDGQKWTVKHEDSKELIQEGHRRFQQGNFTGIPLFVKALATGPGNLGDISSVELWDDKLGIEPEDLEQVVRRVIAEKRGPSTP